MSNLMNWHYEVQEGMYFSRRKSFPLYDVFLSDVIEDGFWNYAYLHSDIPISNVEKELVELFKKENRLPSIYLVDDNPYHKESVDYLLNIGYSLLSTESFMVYQNTDTITIKNTSSYATLVADDRSQNDFIEVFTNAYGGEKTPEQPYGELDKTYMQALIRSFSDEKKFFHFVCYDNNNPVSIASLCFENEKGGIYNVGTNPAFRGKGYGTVATKACIDKWIELQGDTLLLQTETGSAVEKWYEKLGFKSHFVGEIYTKE